MKRIYLDSCVILSYLQQDTRRFDTIDAALSRAQSSPGATRFYTSTISVIEITRLTEDGTLVTPEEFETIQNFWKTTPIVQVELNQLGASQGRYVMQRRLQDSKKHQVPLVQKRVRDLAHLGTAIWLKADEYWSYDTDFGKYPNQQLVICEPHADQPKIPGL